MGTHEAKCHQCGYTAEFWDPLRSYEMPDGAFVTIQKTFVWCAACREVRWGEELPELAALEHELGATKAREPSAMEELSLLVGKYRTLEEVLTDREQELEERVAWRRVRTSGPRCLECGTTDLVPLVFSEIRSGNDKWTLAEHPGCGGRITARELPALTLDRRWIYYTPEGQKKQAYQMSPSKGAVPIDE